MQGVINVRDYGAVGDGVTNDTASIQTAIDACCGSASAPHGINFYLNKQLYFPPGHYRANDLRFTKLQGVRVLGAGRFVTHIETLTPNVPAFRTNGAGYCHFEGMTLTASGKTPVFDLDWDGTAGGAALQSNTFCDVFFGGGDYGILIAKSGFMGSEMLFLNCFWIRNAIAGLMVAAQNSLQHTVVGGNFQTCGHGIWVGGGSVPIVHGVGFQEQSGYDIRVDNGTMSNAMAITGCRTESVNFYRGSVPAHISACAQSNGQKGDFASASGACVISSCYSRNGRVRPFYESTMTVESSLFERADWFQPDQLWSTPGNRQISNIEISNVSYGRDGVTGTWQHVARRRITARPSGGDAAYWSHDYVTGWPRAH